MRKLALLVSIFACDGGAPNGTSAPVYEPKEPGLESVPRWLTYTCAEPGCDTTLTATIRVIGDRDVAIKRVVLSDMDRDDFEITAERAPPFILTAGDEFGIDVRYVPTGDPRLGDVNLRVTYTDAASVDSDERIKPGELLIPLVRRLIGEPAMSVSPAMLNFGPVLPTAQRTLPLTVANDGFGNVGLVIESIEPDPVAELRVERLPESAMVPGESWDLSVVYQPMQESYLEGTITIQPASESAPATHVPVVGTSISHASLLTNPVDVVDFGEVPVGMTVTTSLEVINRGAEDLVLHRMEIGTVPGGILMTQGATTATIAPLESELITLSLEAEDPGEVDTFVRLHTNDREQPVVDVSIIGVMTKAIIEVDRVGIDFGAIPRGWTVVEQLEVTNVGHGELTITNLGLILGSSDLFTMRTVPNLPIVLTHDQRFAVEIEFRSEAEATFNGTLSIDSTDPDTPFIEVPLTAVGASCADACAVANGTPACGGGLCEIDACDPDWYDADGDPATGCECREIGSDPGTFCSEGIYLGTLDDDGDAASFTGIVPEVDDVDMIRFFGQDSTQIFSSDDYDVRVTLQTTDPGIQMCVYRHDTGDHTSECFLENERCGPTFRRDGSSGDSDDADYTVKIFRDPSVPPTCTSYTVFMRNG